MLYKEWEKATTINWNEVGWLICRLFSYEREQGKPLFKKYIAVPGCLANVKHQNYFNMDYIYID